jgi:hypothetical protein
MDSYIPCELIQTKVNLSPNDRVVVLNNYGYIGFVEEEVLSVKIISDFVDKLA